MNKQELRCSNWPKYSHPLVVDFSLHFCLRNGQWIYTWVHYKFLPAQFSWIWRMPKYKFHPLKYFPSDHILKSCHQKFTDHLNAIWYPLQVTEATNGSLVFSNNQFMNGILTWFDCNSFFRNLWIILSDLRFHNTFQFVKCGASA